MTFNMYNGNDKNVASGKMACTKLMEQGRKEGQNMFHTSVGSCRLTQLDNYEILLDDRVE